MRTYAAAALVLLAVAACGGGEEKKAFDRYATVVDPLLATEERNLQRFAEISADAMQYGMTGEIGDYVRGTLLPFTARFRREVEAIRPEAERLRAIHALLVDYVRRRAEFLEVFGQVEAVERAARAEAEGLRADLESMMEGIVTRGNAIQPAYLAAPEFAKTLDETLRRIMSTAEQYQQLLSGLDQGMVPSATYVEAIDGQLLPFIEETRRGLAALGPDAKGEALRDAVIAYLEALRDLVRASRPLTEIRARAEREGAPLKQRLRTLRSQADEALAAYKEEARSYRDGLR